MSELATRYPPRHKLKCNIREVQAGQWQFQATAVWVEGKAPLEYRTKDWYEDLQRAASCYKNKATLHINHRVVNVKLSCGSPCPGPLCEWWARWSWRRSSAAPARGRRWCRSFSAMRRPCCDYWTVTGPQPSSIWTVCGSSRAGKLNPLQSGTMTCSR